MYQCIAFITSNHAFFVIWSKIFFYYNENLKKLKKDKGRFFFVTIAQVVTKLIPILIGFFKF